MPQVPFNNPLGAPFIELQSVDSTNNYALTRIHAGLAQHGTAFFSHEQLAGKGQRGKSWSAGRDEGLILTVVIHPGFLTLIRQFELSACVAVSVHEFFTRYAGDAASIKWPNDLYWHDRKAGGILIENVAGSGPSPEWRWAVAGIGINLNQAQFPGQLRNPVSLLQITGKQHNPVMLAGELCEILEKNYQVLRQSGFETIYKAYNSYLYKQGHTVKLRKGARVFDALIRGVSRNGRLQAVHAIEEEFDFGEVEWIIPGP